VAFQDDLLGDGRLGVSLLVAVGAAVLAPSLIPAVATAARPMFKGAMKLGVTLYEKGNEAVAEASEVMEDLLAEAKAELAKASASGSAVKRIDG
jgi:hypothetical protein